MTTPPSSGHTRAWLAGAIVLAVLVRLPFWTLAFRAPVDADTAIVGLMARHLGLSSTFWGQPYGSPLESWLVIPAVVLGAGGGAVRLLYFILSICLVPLAFALGGRINARAALPAALLVACPPAYGLLIAAMPPPLYPSSLAMGGLLLVLALNLRERLERGESAFVLAALWGALGGLAVWTHLMSMSAVVAGLLCMAPALARRPALAVAILVSILGLSAGTWLPAIQHGPIFSIVRLSNPRITWSEHLLGLLGQLHRPLGGLLGAGVPLVADLEQRLEAPLWVAAPLGLSWTVLAAAGAWQARTRNAGRLAVGVVLLTITFFLIPLRSDVHTIRFLTPLYIPLAALAGAAVGGWGWFGRVVLVSTLALHAAGAVPLLEAWRGADRARAPYFTPDLEPARLFLEARGIRHAFAAYEPAYRLTLQTREAIVVSQPWNERFPRIPLPYLDEVRGANRVAWILTPGIPSTLPSPDAFEAELRRSGGRWQRASAGVAEVFFDFEPPEGDISEPAGAVSWINGHPELTPGRYGRRPRS